VSSRYPTGSPQSTPRGDWQWRLRGYCRRGWAGGLRFTLRRRRHAGRHRYDLARTRQRARPPPRPPRPPSPLRAQQPELTVSAHSGAAYSGYPLSAIASIHPQIASASPGRAGEPAGGRRADTRSSDALADPRRNASDCGDHPLSGGDNVILQVDRLGEKRIWIACGCL
jgi:hypothetical protein